MPPAMADAADAAVAVYTAGVAPSYARLERLQAEHTSTTQRLVTTLRALSAGPSTCGHVCVCLSLTAAGRRDR
jgi:hypothetical protein